MPSGIDAEMFLAGLAHGESRCGKLIHRIGVVRLQARRCVIWHDKLLKALRVWEWFITSMLVLLLLYE